MLLAPCWTETYGTGIGGQGRLEHLPSVVRERSVEDLVVGEAVLLEEEAAERHFWGEGRRLVHDLTECQVGADHKIARTAAAGGQTPRITLARAQVLARVQALAQVQALTLALALAPSCSFQNALTLIRRHSPSSSCRPAGRRSLQGTAIPVLVVPTTPLPPIPRLHERLRRTALQLHIAISHHGRGEERRAEGGG
eukprot:6186626-Pleurochrysis_carterae.AAC.2